MNFILSAKNLCFLNMIKYPQIQIEENKFTFIIGESGSGKSTLLKLLNLTLIPSCGEIFYKEVNIQEINAIEYRKKVLLVSQEIFLFDGTIKENFDLYYSSREQNAADENYIKNILTVCCAEFPLETVCSTLSGGERQRVFLAICLSFLPNVLLLDEPTSALDEKTANQLLQNIKSFCLSNNITPIAVSHNIELVKQFSDCVIDIKKERV